MTDYFAGSPVAGFTRHFGVTYVSEDDVDAAARATAIVATCEADLATLQPWFGVNFDSSPYSILVHVDTGTANGGASTRGYVDDKSSQIWVTGTYMQGGVPVPGPRRDELARMLFVAELAEVLMDFAGRGWRRAQSNGEGLSRVAAATLHPGGYYPTGKGPCVNTWLQSARRDWIGEFENTDTDADSYGCAALFLYYLVYQRGFSFPQVVAAGNQFGDLLVTPSLAQVFSRLTGEPAEAAFSEFSGLLQEHLPAGQAVTLPRDNPFPLRPAGSRTVGFSFDGRGLPGVQDPVEKPVTLRAGVLCEAREYRYHEMHVPFQVTAVGRATGFALPVFAWSVNGVPLPTHGSQATVTVAFTVDDRTPERSESTVSETVDLTYSITDVGGTSTLVMTNTSFPGNGNADITLSATEALIPADPAATYTYNPVLTTLEYAMDAAWTRDVRACDPGRFVAVDNALASLSHQLVDLRNRPDPPPGLLRGLAASLQAYIGSLESVTGGVTGLDRSVSTALAQVAAPPMTVNVQRQEPGSLPSSLTVGDEPQIAEQTD